jgi:uncharacterized protein YfaS (alpha-2-macroglobulin family)
LTLQGTVLGFSTEKSDQLWWLMVSGDVNATRMLLAAIDDPGWRDDVPRLARGLMARQQRGRWDTTVANAWGALAMARFAERFEAQPVTGITSLSTAGGARPAATVDWAAANEAERNVALPWPAGATGTTPAAALTMRHDGSGRPWATIRSRAAVPLRERLESGFRVERTVTPVEQKVPGRWSVGDLMRVRLAVDAQSDMTWVVLTDPVPAGSMLLGSGLGGQGSLAASGATSGATSGAGSGAGTPAATAAVWRRAAPAVRASSVLPVFEERTFEGWRGYYRFVPKGVFIAEYVVRLNQSGRFELPGTRVEAMYAPEMFGELPNAAIEVVQ